MHFSLYTVTALFAAGALASPLAIRDNNGDRDHDNEGGLKKICPNLRTMEGGCVRYTKGFDVTGVVTEVDLTFPLIKDECDCIQQCLDRPTTCASYVWKFSTPASVQSGHRTCTLYSQFNLPADVTLEFDLNNANNKNINAAEILAMGNNPQAGAPVPQALNNANNKNINAAEILAMGNNPQAGAPVPQAFKDANLNVTPDPDAVSGPVWHLANGQIQC